MKTWDISRSGLVSGTVSPVSVLMRGERTCVATNLSRHPALILPSGFRGEDAPPITKPEGAVVSDYGAGTPLSLTFLGRRYGEAQLLTFAGADQEATGFHLFHPKLLA